MPDTVGMTLDRRISLGNILVMAGMIVSMSIAWANLSAKNEAVAEMSLRASTQASSNEARIRMLEQQTIRQDERLTSILSNLSKIDTMVGRIEENQHKQEQLNNRASSGASK